MTACISNYDHILKMVTIFSPPPFTNALSYVALSLQLNSTLTKLSFAVYRRKIGGIRLELWLCPPFVLFFKISFYLFKIFYLFVFFEGGGSFN